MSGKRELGDYQTPLSFTSKICTYLKEERNINPSVVLEPTCGKGNFLKSSLLFNAQKYYGIEINPEYCRICSDTITDERVTIINADFFKYDLKALSKAENVLVIGNPPWVNNSTLSTLGATNLPEKENFKALKGMDAMTGDSNFDICEYIILRLVKEYRESNSAIAMLCKTSVARNVFKELKRTNIGFTYFHILEFNAVKVFGIDTSACLLLIQLAAAVKSPDVCRVYSFDNTVTEKLLFGYKNGRFYSDLSGKADNFDGKCCFEWRQGVKHDCAKIMELEIKQGTWQNGYHELVNIENNTVYPLVKSSMFKKPLINEFSKYVIVTQKKVREDTSHLAQKVPKTWAYLVKNTHLFEARKSSIYHGAPPFSMFGIGDYSYSRYKVGVSGFYKEPLFAVLFSSDGKPVMTDDTGYFICFDTYDEAYVAMLYLNSGRVRSFLKSIAFLDAKRPYTKKVLERLDFSKITSAISFDELLNTEKSLKLQPYLKIEMLNRFIDLFCLN